MLSRVLYRPISGNPLYILLLAMSNTAWCHRSFDRTSAHSSMSETYNVLVSSSNPIVTDYICKEYSCDVEEHPITVVKHLAEVMQTHMINIQTFSCDLHTSDMEWELYYYVPPSISAQVGRGMLQL
jgi:hypothetical protein